MAGTVVVGAGVFSDLQRLKELNGRFEDTANSTDLPDYRVNGLLVHTNDGWADIEVLEQSRELGFVSMSFIRRDVSADARRPIFFDKNFRDIPWMDDQLAGSGVVLDGSAEFTPLCFFIRDAASVNRHHFGCGGYLEVEGQDFDWAKHFARYGFNKIPDILSHEIVALPRFEEVYERETGISSCELYGIRDSFDYDAYLLSDWRTTCSFAIDKANFDLALGFNKKYTRDYNEFLVREWSRSSNPVAAAFYVVSPSAKYVSPSDSALFRGEAIRIRDRYFQRTGIHMPVYQMNLDAFRDTSKTLLEYELGDNWSLRRWLFFDFGWEPNCHLVAGIHSVTVVFPRRVQC